MMKRFGIIALLTFCFCETGIAQQNFSCELSPWPLSSDGFTIYLRNHKSCTDPLNVRTSITFGSDTTLTPPKSIPVSSLIGDGFKLDLQIDSKFLRDNGPFYAPMGTNGYNPSHISRVFIYCYSNGRPVVCYKKTVVTVVEEPEGSTVSSTAVVYDESSALLKVAKDKSAGRLVVVSSDGKQTSMLPAAQENAYELYSLQALGSGVYVLSGAKGNKIGKISVQ